jgi:uncharacterized protein YdbL (DUF1318 family)
MTAWFSRRSTAAALSSLLLLTAVGTAVIASAQPAAAQSAATKAMVDAAKARGAIGEQGDGFLGFVAPSTDPALAAAVAEINQGRTAVYRETAAKTNVTPDAAGQATAQQLFTRLPAGQYFKPLDGNWTRK